MKTIIYENKKIISFFKTNKIATINELKILLGTTSAMTVYRKLREIGYITSCTHRGKYYTLKSIPKFDARGLYFIENICFSKYETLMSTLINFVNKSEIGYYSNELDEVFGVSTKKELLLLFKEKKIDREFIKNKILHCSNDLKKKQQQIKKRQSVENKFFNGQAITTKKINEEELKAPIILFFNSLNEKHRRLFAGLESLKLGYGGDKIIADMLCIDEHTVSNGRKELKKKLLK